MNEWANHLGHGRMHVLLGNGNRSSTFACEHCALSLRLPFLFCRLGSFKLLGVSQGDIVYMPYYSIMLVTLQVILARSSLSPSPTVDQLMSMCAHPGQRAPYFTHLSPTLSTL